MRVAVHTRAPVLLVGDIERGGVFAALVGTLALLEPEEHALVCGLAINKFRGDPAILDSGLSLLHQRTGVPVLGVIPYLRDLDLPEEDSLALEGRAAPAEVGTLDVAVVRFPRIANFDDFDPLAAEPSVSVRYVEDSAGLGQPDLLILPGTKTTLPDLAWLRRTGMAAQVAELAGRGTPILGICGGFQMLGERILDPARSESAETEADGLGLLSLRTTFATTKQTCRVTGSVIAARGPFAAAAGAAVAGYEIHMGQTELGDEASPLFTISERSNAATEERDGLVSPNGLVLGSYLHGLFDNNAIRQALVGWLLERKGERPAPAFATVDRARQYDDLADAVRRSLDVRRLEVACGLV
jgi:adenosylcobyric acid synthase